MIGPLTSPPFGVGVRIFSPEQLANKKNQKQKQDVSHALMLGKAVDPDVVWRGGHDRLDRLALLRLLELDPNLFLEYDELLDLLVLFEAR